MKKGFKMRISTKLLVFVMITTIAVFAIIGFFVANRINRIAYNNAVQIAQAESQKTANLVRSELELDLGFARSLAHSLYVFPRYDSTRLDSVFLNVVKNQILLNQRYMTVWYSLEYWAFVPGYNKMYGRRSTTAYLKNGVPLIQFENKNITGDILTSEYYKSKKCNCELVIDPYIFQLEGVDVLATTISVPVRKNGQFAGLAGVDIELGKFQASIDQIRPYKNTTVFLLSNNGTIIAHSNTEFVKKHFNEVYPVEETEYEVMSNVQKGRNLTYTKRINSQKYLTIISPVTVGETPTPWAVGISVPEKEIMAVAKKALLSTIFVFLVSLVALVVVIWLIARSITEPVQETTRLMNDLAQGDIDKNKKLFITTGDEIEVMAASVNKLIDGLNKTEEFAREIGKGNLDSEYELLGSKDVLGKSLQEMQKSLKHARQIEIERKVEEDKQNWTTQGIAMFGEILRQDNDNLNELSYNIIKNLVGYTGSVQGGIFILNDFDKDNPVVEMTACYAYDRRKFLEKQIMIGEGLVGRCFQEGKTIFMTDLPKDYIHITSGLGKENPRCLLLVPLMVNDDILGVIEMASFKAYDKNQIDFIEKVASSIASTISNVRINIRTAELLAKSQQQAEEMSAQAEEMRQNMEELQATQEDMERKNNDLKELQDNLSKEKTLLDAILNFLPDRLYFKDLNSNFIRGSKSWLARFGASTQEEIVGKNDFDYFDKDHAQQAFDDEQNIIRTETPIINKVEKIVKSDGSINWVSTTKLPFKNAQGETIGTFGITRDITELKQSQEELIKHNKGLEELQKTLAQEKMLLDTLLDNIPDFVYFKDMECRFIRISQSMVPLFKANTTSDLLGKSDFDFHSKEHAQKAYKEEHEIMEGKKKMINEVVHEKFDDGREQWVSTTKMPLLNQSGEVIGIWGISKIVTDLKKAETEAVARAQEAEKLKSEIADHEKEMIQKMDELKIVHQEMKLNEAEQENVRQLLLRDKSILDTLLSYSQVFIYQKDTEGKYVRISNSLLDALNIKSPDEVIGLTDFDLLNKKDAEAILRDEQEVIASMKPIMNKVSYRKLKDGKKFKLALCLIPLVDNTGSISGILGLGNRLNDTN